MSKTLRHYIDRIVGGGTPPRAIARYWQGPIPWASVKDFVDARFDLSETEEHISREAVGASAANLVPAGTPIVVTRMAVGRAGIFSQEVAINQDLKAIYPAFGVDGRFVAYFLQHIRPKLEAVATGSTVKGISLIDLLDSPAEFPPLEEQRRIAAILDASEATIRATEAVIEKLRLEREGLASDLLSGRLSAGSRSQAWPTASLSEICAAIVDCPHSTPVYLDEGVLVARTMHIKSGVFIEAEASRVSEREFLGRIARLEPRPGDIIFTREAPVGEAFEIPTGMRICLGQRVMLLRPDTEKVLSPFLVEQLYSPAVQSRIAMLTGGTTNPHLNVAEVRLLKIMLPPIHEQRAITCVLEAQRDTIKSEKDKLAKLRLQHQALLHDLLTGTVRTCA